MSAGRRRLARKIRDQASHAARRHATTYRGEVSSATPLTIELLHAPITLDEEDFDLTQWVRRYDVEYGIDEGDDVLLMKHGHDWIVTDILSEKDPQDTDWRA